MSSVRLLLGQVMHITPSSVIFSADEVDTLDFQTVSTIPKAHRDFVQKNGLIAKVMLSVTSKITSWSTREERQKIWWDALTSTGLARSKATTVEVPTNLSGVFWPIIDDEQLMIYADAAIKRHANLKLNECPYVVPVLYAQQIFYKCQEVKGTLCVVWMPKCRYNLAHWTKVQVPRRFIPESVLYKLIYDITNALIFLRDVCVEYPACISMEDILVGGVSDAEPSFLLNTLTSRPTCNQSEANSRSSSTVLFAPELLIQPCKLLTNSACNVWSLGMIAYQIASGLPSEESKAHLMGTRHAAGEMMLNHYRLKPSDVVLRVRAVLQAGSYNNPFIHLLLLMLGQDPHTRPTPYVVYEMLRDIMRFKPVIRFPFAIGPFTLVHLWSDDKIAVDPVQRRYDTEATCIVCNESRSNLMCGDNEHTSALCSPLWSAEEPLPGYAVARETSMTYLYPMLGRLDKKAQRRYIDAALRGDKMNRGSLLQLLGGFALLKPNEGKSAVAHDVMIPLPNGVLHKDEKVAVAAELNFTAALPWPSQCTFKLQQEGRIQWSIPGLFGFSNARWYAWILPGEKLELNGEPWVPAPDGAFVFWFNESLQPSEYDRYFVVCSVLSLTWQAKMKSNVLPDHVFKRKGDVGGLTPSNGSEGGFSSCTTSHNGEGSAERHSKKDVDGVNKSGRSALGQRSVNSLLNLPKVGDLQCTKGDGILPARRQVSSTANTTSSSSNSCDSDNSNPNHRRPPRRGSAVVRMDYVDDVVPDMIFDGTGETNSKGQPLQPQQRNGVTGHRSNSTEGIISVLHRSEDGMACSTPREPTYPRERPQGRHINPQPTEPTANPRPPPPNNSPGRRQRHEGEGKFGRLPSGMVTTPTLSKSPSGSRFSGRPSSPSAADVNRTLSPKESAVLQQSKTGFPLQSPPLRVFGRWHPPRHIDAPFQSLTFCTSSTAEHGTLSPPVMLSMGVRTALHAPAAATHMAFAANIMPLVRRNHPKSSAALVVKENNARDIIPHHGLVFYDEKEEVVGLLALRFALTRSPDITTGEMLLPIRLLPPVVATAAFNAQLNAAYFTGNAVFHSITRVGSESEVLRHSESLQHLGNFETLSPLSKKLTLSGARFGASDDPPHKVVCGDDDVLPFCWIGFENQSRMLMISDVHRLSWYPLYFTDE
ncbi:uncharacterized protein TEOVI_000293900 [Trypanosoma equiperdum]|uniref:Protein kinase domain-containing protein n=1 Tax=Trypanosoma equiperdum TaxID=5694 RepID=A0A1G4IGN5_TRYEQ|nr:hypothetical protein, conserved [Trypanosoma equiperdum]